jgi:hypothetical protein
MKLKESQSPKSKGCLSEFLAGPTGDGRLADECWKAVEAGGAQAVAVEFLRRKSKRG